MDPVTSLFVALGALYLIECLHWVRRDASVFGAWIGPRCKSWSTNGPLGNAEHTLVLASPLPPLGHLMVVDAPLVAWGTQSVVIAGQTIEAGPAQADGKKVTLGGLKLSWSSAAAARAFVETYQSWSTSKKKAAWLEARVEPQDTTKIEARLKEYLKTTRWLRFFAVLEFWALLALVPLLFWVPRTSEHPWWLLGGLYSLHLVVVVLHHRAYRRLYPEPKAERWVRTVTLLLNIPGGIRTAPGLGRDLFAGADPLAVAQVVLSPKHFEPWAAQHLRRLHHPILPPMAEAAQNIVASDFERRRQAAHRLLKRHGLAVDSFLKAPEPESTQVTSYCPRCLTQYAQGDTCADCIGVRLKPLQLQ